MEYTSQIIRRIAFPRMFAAVALAVVAITATPANAAVLTIQPIQVCDDGGGSCANSAQELYLDATNKIWAQAGLTFNYLGFTTTNSSTFLTLEDQTEVDSLFSTAPGAAVNPLVISMWFVADHYSAYGEVNAIGGNKIVISQSVFTAGRLDTIAHEVGHLLGLLHDDAGVETDFLMRSGESRLTPTVLGDITPDGAGLDRLTGAQITTALSDSKIDAVPEPGTFATMFAGLGVLGFVMRRRQKGSRG